MKPVIRLRSIFVLIIVVVILSACGGDANSYGTASSGYAGSSLSVVEYADADVNEEVSPEAQEQLLIYTGTLRITTKNYDGAIEHIFNSLQQAGGYMVAQDDTSNERHRSSKIVVRIPSQYFFTWIEDVEQIPNSKFSKSISAEDVSEEYVDLAARLEAKQLVIDKYKEYVQLATTADDLIRYTNEMANLQEEIDSVQARLRYLQNRVMYSTITINVNDDAHISFFNELDLKDRFVGAWKNGIDGLFYVITSAIFLLIALSPLIVIAGVVIVIFIRNKRRKKNNDKSDK